MNPIVNIRLSRIAHCRKERAEGVLETNGLSRRELAKEVSETHGLSRRELAKEALETHGPKLKLTLGFSRYPLGARDS